jgi:hypothetical protein
MAQHHALSFIGLLLMLFMMFPEVFVWFLQLGESFFLLSR